MQLILKSFMQYGDLTTKIDCQQAYMFFIKWGCGVH
jgi:hypothetical protein